MVLFELDPDIIRWGLHHLLPAPAGYSADNRTQTTPTTPCTAFVRPLDQPTGDMGTSNSVEIKVEHVNAVDNDEVIAQALQEELSHVALAEASVATSAADDQQHSAVLEQQWLRPRAVLVESCMTLLFIFKNNIPFYCIHPLLVLLLLSAIPPPASQEAGTREEPFSTCSSPGDGNTVQDSQACLIELMDDFSVLDGEVDKRLNNMVPVPVSTTKSLRFLVLQHASYIYYYLHSQGLP